MALRTERDVAEALDDGAFTVDELYEACVAAGVSQRDHGHRPIATHGSDQVYKRRARGALQTLRRCGHARRVAPGTWIITGTRERPRCALLVPLSGDLATMELVLGDAIDILAQAEEPVDFVVTDPPYSLQRGHADAAYRRTYRRDHDRVMPGYIDVPAAAYAEFTAGWVTAAARALRPGGHLAVVTGPQQAARVQVAGEAAGLSYVNSIAVKRHFPMRTTRRLAHSHWTVTVLCRGPLDSPARYYACPDDLPRARSGLDYGQDLWLDIPPHYRLGELRWDNELPPLLIHRLVRAFTRQPTPGQLAELIADPFLGGGTTAWVTLALGRRFLGGDLAPEALRLTMARILDCTRQPVLPFTDGPR
jgi:DNA methylase